MKHILFLLSGNISTTPRALKIIQLAIKNDYQVDLCLINRLDKWKSLDDNILLNVPCKVNYIPFRKKDGLLLWIASSVVQKISIILSKRIKNNLTIKAFASSKINILYHLYLRRSNKRYDFIIGFSGMYYPAYLYSQKHHIPFAFDMEDYHPGEVIYHHNKKAESERRIWMIKKIYPMASYISYASPLIEERTYNLLKDNLAIPPYGFTLNNTFCRNEFCFSPCHDQKVKFVWFSQTISHGRGLEIILPILNRYKDNVSLTLIGNVDNGFYKSILFKYKDILEFKDAMPQPELHKEIGKYDIGLAIEQDVDENRSLCLTNKIFAYLLSGLYILATSTPAQKKLMRKNPLHGVVVDSEIEYLDQHIKLIIDNIELIRSQKQERFDKVANLSWECEEHKLLDVWKKLI